MWGVREEKRRAAPLLPAALNGTATLTAEERLVALAMARAFAQDLLRIAKVPLRREILAQAAWILEGSSPPVQG